MQDAGRGPLAGVDLRLESGRIGWVQGPSGSGKTLLLYLAAGLVEPARGRIRVDEAPPGPGRVAMLFQNPDYQLVATRVADDVAMGAEMAAVSPALAATGCNELADRPMDGLSPGQRRRVALAGVLAAAPPLVLLDTPFAGMGCREAAELWSAVRLFLVEQGCGVLITGEPPGEAPGDPVWDVTRWRSPSAPTT